MMKTFNGNINVTEWICDFVQSRKSLKLKCLIFIFTTLHLHHVHVIVCADSCDIFYERKNSYLDLSICHHPGATYNTKEKCVQKCNISNNCSAIVYGTTPSSNDCWLLNDNGPLLVWPGSLTLYHKKATTFTNGGGGGGHPCSSQWTAPSGWNITVPVTHVDFTNTTCVQTFSGASAVSQVL